MQHLCFPDLGKEKLCSVLVFGNVCFNIVVRINHDDVASRGAVGRTLTIVRLQTRIRRKDGTENLGFRICIGFGIAVPPLPRIVVFRVCRCTSFCVVGFCVLGSSQFLFRLPRRGLPRPYRYI